MRKGCSKFYSMNMACRNVMKVFIFGSTQVEHIVKIYDFAGHKCVKAKQHEGSISGKIKNLFEIINSNIVYCVGGVDINSHPYIRVARFLKKRIVIHWIGTDVLNAVNSCTKVEKKKYNKCINLAGSLLLKSELEEIGIKSFIVPIVPTNIKFCPVPMPEKHAILSYIPEKKEKFYGIDKLKDLARNNKEIDFFIVANCGATDEEKLANMHYLGFVNSEKMKELYLQCSILFRYPEHDGLSMMLIEALGLGRSVIYKYEFPYSNTPKDDSIESLQKELDDIVSKKPQLNYEAINYINEEFSMEKQIEKYKNAGII